MKTKGSIVIKRRHLLNIQSNLELMWRNKELSDKNRGHLFGRMSMFSRIMDGDTLNYRWNDYIQHYVWTGSYCTCPPSKTFEWLFDPTPLEIEEHLETMRVLNMAWLLR